MNSDTPTPASEAKRLSEEELADIRVRDHIWDSRKLKEVEHEQGHSAFSNRRALLSHIDAIARELASANETIRNLENGLSHAEEHRKKLGANYEQAKAAADEARQQLADAKTQAEGIVAEVSGLREQLAAVKQKLSVWARGEKAPEVADKAAALICDLEDRVLELSQRVRNDSEILVGQNFWRWQGDGHDFPESLVCQVVMTAGQLRELIKGRQQLAAIADPKDVEGLAEVYWGEARPSIQWRELSTSAKENVTAGAKKLASHVRGPLLQQIAELEQQIESDEVLKRLNKVVKQLAAERERREAAENSIHELEESVGQAESLANERGRDLSALRTRHEGLVRAGDGLEQGFRFFHLAAQMGHPIPAAEGGDEDANVVQAWRNAKAALAQPAPAGGEQGEEQPPAPEPEPAKPEQEPHGLCPKCGIQPLTKDTSDMRFGIKLREQDWLCGLCKRYMCEPIKSKPEQAAFVCPECKGELKHYRSRDNAAQEILVCQLCNNRTTFAELCGAITEVEAAKAKAAQPDKEKPSSLRQLVTALGFTNFDCPKCKGQYFKAINPDWQTTGQPQRIRCSGRFIEVLNEYTGCTWEGTFDDLKAAQPDHSGDAGEKVEQPATKTGANQ